MKYQDNVILIFTRTNKIILAAVEQACREILGEEAYEPTCTSGADGTHSAESGHYYGRALDFRNRDMPRDQLDFIEQTIRAILGKDYFLLREKDHLHIQRNKNSFL